MQITDPKRLNAMIEAIGMQCNEAANARVHALANGALLRQSHGAHGSR